MTYIELLKRIDTLAPLPKTILDIEDFKSTNDYDTGALARIIEQDPLMVSSILKTANSAMFGFVSQVDTLNRAVNLLGINFTISIALGSGIKRALESDLNAYKSTSDDFLGIANMQSNLVNLWIGKIDAELRNELILPAFLQESGKFVINKAVEEENKTAEFVQKISNHYIQLEVVEKEFVGMSTAQVTSSIFKHWNLTKNIINYIKFSDDPSQALPEYKKHAQILHIVKIMCNFVNPLDHKAVTYGMQKAAEFGFDTKILQNAVSKMEDRLLDEK